jgi:hypothetical protein
MLIEYTLEQTISLVLGMKIELYNSLLMKTDAFYVARCYILFTVVAVTQQRVIFINIFAVL